MITVLLVHDNTDLIDVTRSFLEKGGGIRVDTVSSTKQALEIARNRNYDVIVSYYHLPEVNGIEFLPEMNGVELLKYLKSHGNPTPFILYARMRLIPVSMPPLPEPSIRKTAAPLPKPVGYAPPKKRSSSGKKKEGKKEARKRHVHAMEFHL